MVYTWCLFDVSWLMLYFNTMEAHNKLLNAIATTNCLSYLAFDRNHARLTQAFTYDNTFQTKLNAIKSDEAKTLDFLNAFYTDKHLLKSRNFAVLVQLYFVLLPWKFEVSLQNAIVIVYAFHLIIQHCCSLLFHFVKCIWSSFVLFRCSFNIYTRNMKPLAMLNVDPYFCNFAVFVVCFFDNEIWKQIDQIVIFKMKTQNLKPFFW